jgi:hypothetical protein
MGRALFVHRRRAEGCLPRDVKMVSFLEDFLRARTACGDALRVGRCSNCSSIRSWSNEIDSASCEVE